MPSIQNKGSKFATLKVSLRHVDYFVVIIFEKQKAQEETSTFPLAA